MNEKLDILQQLIGSRMFASSPAALAKVLGYKGKMSIYRLMKGDVSPQLVEEVWEKVQETFEATDEDLRMLTDVRKMALALQQELLHSTEEKSPEQTLKLFIKEECYPEIFDEETASVLRELRKDHPNLFWEAVLLVFLKRKGTDPYRKVFGQTYREWLNRLDDFLFATYPENIRARKSIEFMKKATLQSLPLPSVWWLLYSGSIVCRTYTEPDFLRLALAAYQPQWIDCPETSYWIVPNSTYGKGENVWVWIRNNLISSLHGGYNVHQLKSGGDTETFLAEAYYIFLFGEAGEEKGLQITDEKGNSYFYQYEYDPHEGILHILPYPDNECAYPLLPAFMQCINRTSSPLKTNEKIWKRLLENFVNGKGRSLIQAMAGNIGLMEEYNVKDVIVSREYFSLILVTADQEKEYRIPLNAYSFLANITSTEEIWISRHTDDNEIYVEWPLKGYGIKLSEFEMPEP